MIVKQSKISQFILSTFRKESLEYAENFYMINMNNKESTINQIDRITAEDAMEESDDEEEEDESEEERSEEEEEEDTRGR